LKSNKALNTSPDTTAYHRPQCDSDVGSDLHALAHLGGNKSHGSYHFSCIAFQPPTTSVSNGAYRVAERNAQPQKDPKKSTKFQKEGYAQPGK
jgi:hypothetical protein